MFTSSLGGRHFIAPIWQLRKGGQRQVKRHAQSVFGRVLLGLGLASWQLCSRRGLATFLSIKRQRVNPALAGHMVSAVMAQLYNMEVTIGGSEQRWAQKCRFLSNSYMSQNTFFLWFFFKKQNMKMNFRFEAICKKTLGLNLAPTQSLSMTVPEPRPLTPLQCGCHTAAPCLRSTQTPKRMLGLLFNLPVDSTLKLHSFAAS